MTPEQKFDVSVEQLVRRARDAGHTIPCKRGCANCCYDIAIVSHLEMPPIIERLRRMDFAELQTVAIAVEDWAQRARAAGVDQMSAEPNAQVYFRAKLACPLLNQETSDCRIYENRPVACRGHYVFNVTPEHCANRPFLPPILMLMPKEALNEYFPAVLNRNGKPPNKIIARIFPAMLHHIFQTLLPYPERTVDDWIRLIENEPDHPNDIAIIDASHPAFFERLPNTFSAFTLFQGSNEFPGKIIVRRFDSSAGRTEPRASKHIRITDTVEAARKLLAEQGLVRIERDPNDSPAVVESWI